MTDEKLNQRLHEIVGLCWHEWGVTITSYYTEHIKCTKCPENYWRTPPPLLDFVNTWEGFGILWEFMHKHERWEDFISATMSSGRNLYLISPTALAKAVVEFFKEKR